jgi:hypothetical protein
MLWHQRRNRQECLNTPMRLNAHCSGWGCLSVAARLGWSWDQIAMAVLGVSAAGPWAHCSARVDSMPRNAQAALHLLGRPKQSHRGAAYCHPWWSKTSGARIEARTAALLLLLCLAAAMNG